MNEARTPDGRYLIIDDVLLRASTRALDEATRAALVTELMNARRAVKEALRTGKGMPAARARMHNAKVQLGERGLVWWMDGAPDFNRRRIANTPYATTEKTTGSQS